MLGLYVVNCIKKVINTMHLIFILIYAFYAQLHTDRR